MNKLCARGTFQVPKIEIDFSSLQNTVHLLEPGQPNPATIQCCQELPRKLPEHFTFVSCGSQSWLYIKTTWGVFLNPAAQAY